MEFKADTSLLSVCPFCQSAVARTGGDVGELELLGKVAPLADLGSPLRLGTTGRYRGRAFTLIGRLQLDYGAGPWNEWYAAFEGDGPEWGWVAEAQGRLYVTFARRASGEAVPLPRYDRARVGTELTVDGRALSIVERRRSRVLTAEGELPERITPDAIAFYCDLEGAGGVFGTIDYGDQSEEPVLYLGAQVQYSELFEADVLREASPAEAPGAESMSCPSCGAGVALRAPDEAQRVTCDACDSLLDCSRGTSLFRLGAAKQRGVPPVLPVGATGELFDQQWTIYGHLTRSVTIDEVTYLWDEWLLRAPNVGYRWLVLSDGHWSFVEPVQAGEVRGQYPSLRYRGETFRHFQSASATVQSIRGEFYWKVAVGEVVEASDYVCPPSILSKEENEEEVTWSLGQYVEREVIRRAFRPALPLPHPRTVGANQPNPWVARTRVAGRLAGVSSVMVLLVAAFFSVTAREAVLFDRSFHLSPRNPELGEAAVPAQAGTTATAGSSTKGLGALVTSEPFVVSARSNLAIRVTPGPGTTWFYVDGLLVEEATNLRTPFGVNIHSSREDSREVYLGDIGPGTYTMTLLPEWTATNAPPDRFTVAVEEDVFIGSHALAALLALWGLAVVPFLGRFTFEKARWQESDHG